MRNVKSSEPRRRKENLKRLHVCQGFKSFIVKPPAAAPTPSWCEFPSVCASSPDTSSHSGTYLLYKVWKRRLSRQLSPSHQIPQCRRECGGHNRQHRAHSAHSVFSARIQNVYKVKRGAVNNLNSLATLMCYVAVGYSSLGRPAAAYAKGKNGRYVQQCAQKQAAQGALCNESAGAFQA